MHRCHECNVLTDPLNLSALALPTCTQCVSILNCSGLAELKRTSSCRYKWKSETPLLASTRVRVALSRMFSMPKGLEIIWHHRLQYLAFKTLAHFASSPRRSVKTDWPYSKKGQGQFGQNHFCQFSELTRKGTLRPDRPVSTDGKLP